MNIVEKIRRAGQRKGMREGMQKVWLKAAARKRYALLTNAGRWSPTAVIVRITGLSEDDVKSLTY